MAATMEKSYYRQMRGDAPIESDQAFQSLSDDELVQLLQSSHAQTRTCAARILGCRRSSVAISSLCLCLQTEKALYARISASEALSAIGLPAINALVNLLGKIGNNQYHSLPEKGFYKKSYPLPRDLAARTLIRMGTVALDSLEDVLCGKDRAAILEGIDAIGFISCYAKDTHSMTPLVSAWQRFHEDHLLQWKLVRAMQSFPGNFTVEVLSHVILNHPVPQLRWEAVRSLGVSQDVIHETVFQSAVNDPDPEVRKMAKIFFTG